MRRYFKPTIIRQPALALGVALVLCFWSGQSHAQSPSVNAPHPSHVGSPHAIDPFLAGALGFIPFTSGLYLGKNPGQGLVFTLVDITTTAGIYTALKTNQGEPENAPYFYLIMAAANALDAVVSVRKSLRTQKLRISPVTYDAYGRVSSSLTFSFEY